MPASAPVLRIPTGWGLAGGFQPHDLLQKGSLTSNSCWHLETMDRGIFNIQGNSRFGTLGTPWAHQPLTGMPQTIQMENSTYFTSRVIEYLPWSPQLFLETRYFPENIPCCQQFLRNIERANGLIKQQFTNLCRTQVLLTFYFPHCNIPLLSKPMLSYRPNPFWILLQEVLPPQPQPTGPETPVVRYLPYLSCLRSLLCSHFERNSMIPCQWTQLCLKPPHYPQETR